MKSLDWLFFLGLKKTIETLKEVAVDQWDFEQTMTVEVIEVPPGSFWISRSLMCCTSKQHTSASDIKQQLWGEIIVTTLVAEKVNDWVNQLVLNFLFFHYDYFFFTQWAPCKWHDVFFCLRLLIKSLSRCRFIWTSWPWSVNGFCSTSKWVGGAAWMNADEACCGLIPAFISAITFTKATCDCWQLDLFHNTFHISTLLCVLLVHSPYIIIATVGSPEVTIRRLYHAN